MTLSPILIAGHKAVTELLAGKDVRVKTPEESVAEFAALMPRNTVNVSVWRDTVNVTFSGDETGGHAITVVPYPVSHGDPDFKEKLGELLLPTVEKYLSRLPVSK